MEPTISHVMCINGLLSSAIPTTAVLSRCTNPIASQGKDNGNTVWKIRCQMIDNCWACSYLDLCGANLFISAYDLVNAGSEHDCGPKIIWGGRETKQNGETLKH